MDRAEQLAAARERFSSKFPDAESKSAYFAELGRRSAEARQGGLVLSHEETEALAAVYRLLRRVARRVQQERKEVADGTSD